MAAGQHKDSSAAALGGGGEDEGQRFDRLSANGVGISRRVLLGAAAALPFASIAAAVARGPLHQASCGHARVQTAPGSPQPVRGTGGPAIPRPGEELVWRRALARFEAAEARARALEGLTGRSHAEQMALEDAYGERLDIMYASLRRLLRAPAPDLAALGRKIVLAVDHEVATLWRGEACMRAVKRDALRLCMGTVC